ncbi:MAG: hypothetical protein AAFP70_14400, partial [Calditrichota bacterium]
MKTPLIILLLIGGFTSLFAQTIEFRGKSINQDTRWSGKVYIYQDVTVKRGVTLSIDPGTRIIIRHRKDRGNSGKAKDRVELIVQGRLIARGTPE